MGKCGFDIEQSLFSIFYDRILYFMKGLLFGSIEMCRLELGFVV